MLNILKFTFFIDLIFRVLTMLYNWSIGKVAFLSRNYIRLDQQYNRACEKFSTSRLQVNSWLPISCIYLKNQNCSYHINQSYGNFEVWSIFFVDMFLLFTFSKAESPIGHRSSQHWIVTTHEIYKMYETKYR